MADNAQKTWYATALPAAAAAMIEQALHSAGNALPCSVVAVNGQLVKVNFLVQGAQTLPQIWIPIDTSIYDWMPIQVGDLGRAVGGTIYIGGVSGQGGGVANMTPRGNLSCLVFQPIANAGWTSPGNQNQRVVQGPAGVLIQTTGSNEPTIDLTTSEVTIAMGSTNITVSAAGVIINSGTVIIDTLPASASTMGQLFQHSGTVMVVT